MSMAGNKGEWSEIYVFLKLLADGRLDAADSDLNKLPNIYYPILQILREEGKPLGNTQKLKYELNAGFIKIIDGDTQEILHQICKQSFINRSLELFEQLNKSSGRTFSFPDIEDFLKSIYVQTLKAKSTDKSDIQLVVHDLKTNTSPQLGFSIKSNLGQSSTLFNAGKGTNFIYEVVIPKNKSIHLAEFNKETLAKPKITNRISKLVELGCEIKFKHIQSPTLHTNLIMVDSLMPSILSHILLGRYKKDTEDASMQSLVEIVALDNPLEDYAGKHPTSKNYYTYKVCCFLEACALGMTPETIWNGQIDATGGIIVVKKDGELACYHIYNRNEFQRYLLKNTKLEQPSTGEDDNNPGHEKLNSKPYRFGWLYEDQGKFYIKLNLQIRFK